MKDIIPCQLHVLFSYDLVNFRIHQSIDIIYNHNQKLKHCLVNKKCFDLFTKIWQRNKNTELMVN